MPYKDPEKQAEAVRRWHEKYPDKASARKAKWYQENKERRDAANRLWRRSRHAEMVGDTVTKIRSIQPSTKERK